jgi:PhzF family phenazine biosynthesis protein
VATVAALRHRGQIGEGALTLETGAGIIGVAVAGDQITMTQIAPTFGAKVPADIVAAVGGLMPDDVVGEPQIVSTGLPFCITVLRDRATVDRLALNLDALAAYAAYLGQDGIDVMEPFWVTTEGATAAGDTYARLLLAPPSPPEDPFTGSASGAMAAYLWAKGMIDAPSFVAEQGHGMGRPGQARIRVLGPRDAITGVEVGGRGTVVMSGVVYLPD